MIVLDTNVISEPLHQRPDSGVASWLNAQNVATLYVTSVTIGEMLLGVELLPEGRRRSRLRAATIEIIDEVFADRVLDFDRSAASEFAARMASSRRDGATVSTTDGQIGAIAAAHGFSVATRDAAPFAALGVPVIDPWSAAGTQG